MPIWEEDVERLKTNDPSLTKLSLKEFTAVLPSAVRGVVLASPYQHLSSSSTVLTPSGGTTEGPKESQEHLLRTTQQAVVGSASLARVDGVKSLPPASDAAKVQVADIHSRAVGISNVHHPSKLFTASYGERVLFRQVGGQWQAVLLAGIGTSTHKRTLPVVSSGDIGMLLADLQRQDVWASRSRIHIMATAHPPYAPCVYLGKAGLLGGARKKKVPSSEQWLEGPIMILNSKQTKEVVHHIPAGYRFKSCRLTTDSVIQRAAFTISYVGANNRVDIDNFQQSKDSSRVQGNLSGGIQQVVSLGTLGVGVQSSFVKFDREVLKQRTKHAGLVLFGKTARNGLFCNESNKSKIYVKLEICVEKTKEAQLVTPNVPPTPIEDENGPTPPIPPAPTPRITKKAAHLPSPATRTLRSSNPTDLNSDLTSEAWLKIKEAIDDESSKPIRFPMKFIESFTNNLDVSLKLGVGAFGVVYQGKYDNRVFAVKHFYYDIAVKKDKTELEALKRFRHPNIVSLYGYRLSSVSPNQYFVFEYASKGSLDKFYESEQSRATLSSEIRLRIIYNINSAIHFLHTKRKDYLGLFHRDIKSANIWLSNNYTAKLIDCGLSKFVPNDGNAISMSVQNSLNGGVFGTPGYKCPWYSRGGKKFEASCDVYSFGIVMIELVTGCLQNDKTRLGDFYERYFPDEFEGNIDEALVLAILKLVEDVDPLAKNWDDGILASVCTLAIRCIQRNRNRRPNTF